MPATRPEFENPPDIFYNAAEARRYTVSTRIQTIQRQMTLRALELLNLASSDGSASSALLLDVGCGSGISGEVLTEQGHTWVGVDISRDMLNIAKTSELEWYNMTPASQVVTPDTTSQSTRVDTSHVKWGPISAEDDDDEADEGDSEETASSAASAPMMMEVLENDIGQGVPFRPGTFDGCVSISVIQWLCHSSRKGEVPQRRLMTLFQSLYNALRRGAKAVLQFYPSNPQQIDMITRAAMKCGFSGGVVIDYPHSSTAKKHYLVLQAGQVSGGFVPPPGLTGQCVDDEEEGEDDGDEEGYGEEEEEDGQATRTRIQVGGRDRGELKRGRAHGMHERKRRRKDNRPITGSKEWVLMKKDERRRRGYKTTADSKYTMRPRKPRF